MATNGGAVEFEFLLKNDRFKKAIDESESRVKGLSSETAASNRIISDSFDLSTENIRIHLIRIYPISKMKDM